MSLNCLSAEADVSLFIQTLQMMYNYTNELNITIKMKRFIGVWPKVSENGILKFRRAFPGGKH